MPPGLCAALNNPKTPVSRSRRMDVSADGFYDLFAAHYHLLWEDWERRSHDRRLPLQRFSNVNLLRLTLPFSIAPAASGLKHLGWYVPDFSLVRPGRCLARQSVQIWRRLALLRPPAVH